MPLPTLENLLFQFNRLRHGAPNDDPWSGQLDRLAEAAFRATGHLIVYGSLAPGRPNHACVAALPGSWESGWGEGDLEMAGWGASLGFPALQWRPGGSRVSAYLLRSDALREHWAELDRFEGWNIGAFWSRSMTMQACEPSATSMRLPERLLPSRLSTPSQGRAMLRTAPQRRSLTR